MTSRTRASHSSFRVSFSKFLPFHTKVALDKQNITYAASIAQSSIDHLEEALCQCVAIALARGILILIDSGISVVFLKVEEPYICVDVNNDYKKKGCHRKKVPVLSHCPYDILEGRRPSDKIEKMQCIEYV
jgi:hypothetical protein